MIDILYEHRAHPKRSGPIRLMSRSQAEALGGFVSVHGFPGETARAVQDRQGTYSLDRLPLYLDKVILDFDDAEDAYQAAVKVCQDRGWAYQAYHTGNRGYHLYIDIIPLCEVGVYKRAAYWVSQYFRGYDDSMYKPSGITRIPGTYHAKTGKPMVLVGSGGTLTPDIHVVELIMPKGKYQDADKGDWDLEGDFAVMLQKRISAGGRNGYAYRLFARGLQIGVESEALWSLVTRWNTTRCDPALPEYELMQTYKSAQRRGMRA